MDVALVCDGGVLEVGERALRCGGLEGKGNSLDLVHVSEERLLEGLDHHELGVGQ